MRPGAAHHWPHENAVLLDTTDMPGGTVPDNFLQFICRNREIRFATQRHLD